LRARTQSVRMCRTQSVRTNEGITRAHAVHLTEEILQVTL